MKTKVLIFIDWFSPGYKAGGPITSNVNMVSHLKSHYLFYVMTSAYDYHCIEPYSGIEFNKWVDVNGYKICYLDKASLSYRKMKELVSDVKCDVWYINGVYSKYFSLFPLLLAKELSPRKIIVCARGMLSPHALAINGAMKKTFLFLGKQIGLYKKVVFHATSDEERCSIQQLFRKNQVETISNLPKLQIPKLKNKEKEKGRIRLVSFARVSPEKNTLFAIQALKRCKKIVNYDIYGQINSEEYWKECKKQIATLPSNVTISYKGCMDPSGVAAVYQNYDFMYLPTTGENFGHAILESIINGCPVIISDKTPWRKLFEKGIGWDLPLSEELFADIVDKAANMTQVDYYLFCQNVYLYAQKIQGDNDIIKTQYNSLFS